MDDYRKNRVKRRIISIMCLAAVGTSVTATGLPKGFIVPMSVSAYTDSVNSKLKSPDAATAKVIDLSSHPIGSVTLGNTLYQCINVNIEESGTYILKGSTMREDVDNEKINIDAKISIAKGVTADIILDGVQINNASGQYYSSKTHYISPFEVSRNAVLNLYTRNDSEITAKCVHSVDGTLNVMSLGDNDAKLTLNLQSDFDGNGIINFVGGNTSLSSREINCNYTVTGGKLDYNCTAYGYKKMISGGDVTINREKCYYQEGTPTNSEGKNVLNYEITLPDVNSKTEIKQIEIQRWRDLYTDETGKVNVCLPINNDMELDATSEKPCYVYTDDAVYRVYSLDGNIIVEKVENAVTHCVTFKYEDGTSAYYYVVDGETARKFAEEDKYNYSYKSGGRDVDWNAPITADTVIDVNRQVKTYDVTINDKTQTFEYDQYLPDGAYFFSSAIDYCGFDQDTFAVQELPSNCLIRLDEVERSDGKKYCVVNNEEEFFAVTQSEPVWDKGFYTVHGSFNALLNNDITLYTLKVPGYLNFNGIFDGMGHKITLNYSSSQQYASPFPSTYYATIRNLIVDGSITYTGTASQSYIGGIVGRASRTSIENCVSSVNVIAGDSLQYIGGIVGYATGISIENCLFDGKISGDASYAGGFAGCMDGNSEISSSLMLGDMSDIAVDDSATQKAFFGLDVDSNTKLENCYYNADYINNSKVTVGDSAEAVSAEDLESGKFTFDKLSSWYQTLSGKNRQKYPMPVGDEKTQRVYFGYVDCVSDGQAYTNVDHPKKGHKITGSGTDCVACEYGDVKFDAVFDGEDGAVTVDAVKTDNGFNVVYTVSPKKCRAIERVWTAENNTETDFTDKLKDGKLTFEAAGNNLTLNVEFKKTHKFSDWKSNGDGTHSSKCSACGEVETENCSGGAIGYFKKAVCDVCHSEYGELAVDKTAPTGEIIIGKNKWADFVNKITFGLALRGMQTVSIDVHDDSYDHIGYTKDKAVKVEYLLSNEEHSIDELSKMKFTKYTGRFDIKRVDDFVVYARLTDHAGNVRYISSEGFRIEVVYGDADRDGDIAAADVMAMRKKIAKWDIDIDELAADCNADGRFDSKDVLLLRKYLASWPVTLGPKDSTNK